LSGLNKKKFQTIISKQSYQIDSITKARDLTILFDFCMARTHAALQPLPILKNENPTERLPEFYPEIEPDNGQFETICDALNIKICRPRTLDLSLRYYCDRKRVADVLI
jgi:hypothetical protein